MALNTRELYLVLKARDEASRAIRTFGGNLSRLGELQKRLDAAQVAGAAKVAAQREVIARAQVAVEEAKLAKIAEIRKAEIRYDEAVAAAAKARSNAEKLASQMDIDSALKSVEAAKVRADAAISGAQKQVAAERMVQAALARTTEQEMLSIRGLIRQENARQMAAQRRLAVGTSLMTGGVFGAAIGAVGIAELNRMTNVAAKYTQEVAKTKTQTDQVKVSTAQLGKMGTDVFTNMAVDAEKVQPTLYDIFSSIDVNAPEAAQLLKDIGKASVAGATDMQVAGKAIIGVLNAYKMSAGDAGHVSDVLFQLVRKGVGTYQDFSSTIGRAVPSAIKANQTFESLSGILAFLTRNGLSAAMSAASAGRALDALANPKSILAFRNMGDKAEEAITKVSGKAALAQLKAQGVNFKTMSLNLLDVHGNMRPVVDIIHELNAQLNGLTKEQKAATLQEIFKGSGGTIQAMRFFNHALNDSNDLLGELTKSMNNAGGATQDAYNIMSKTPEAQVQLLKNRMHALAITMGNDLLPIKLKVVTALAKMVGWFERLSPEVKKTIAYTLAFVSAMTLLMGVLAILGGMFTALAGGLELMAGHLAVFVASAGAFAVVAAGILLVIKFHKQLAPLFKRVWNDFVNLLKYVKDEAKKVWDGLVGLLDVVKKHSGDLKEVVKALGNMFHILFVIIKAIVGVTGTALVGALKVLAPILELILKLLGLLASLFNALPSSVQTYVIAIGLIGFAYMRLAASAAEAGMSMRTLGAIMLSNARTATLTSRVIRGALGGLAIGGLIGTATANSSGGAKAGGILASIAGGAALGSAGGVPGAIAGGLLGGLSSAITSLGLFGAANDDAKKKEQQHKQALDALVDSLDRFTGASNGFTLQSLSGALSDSGLPDMANQLKIDVNTASQAALGDPKAIDTITKKYKLFYDTMKGGAGAVANNIAPSQRKLYATFVSLMGVINGTNKDVAEAKKQWWDLAQIEGRTVGNTHVLKSSLEAQLKTLGLNKAEIAKYINGIKKLPAKKITSIEAKISDAMAKARSLQGQIDKIRQGKVPGINADTAEGKRRIAELQSDIYNLRGVTIGIGVDLSKAIASFENSDLPGFVKDALLGNLRGIQGSVAYATSGPSVNDSGGGGGGGGGGGDSSGGGSGGGSKAKAKYSRIQTLMQTISNYSKSGTAAQLKKAEDSLRIAINVSGYKGNAALNKYLSAREKLLNKYAKSRDKWNKQLKKAQTDLDKMKQDKAQLSSQVAGTVTGSFDITKYFSFSDSKMMMNQAVKDAKHFIWALKRMKHLGYSGAVIASLASAGPSANPVIDALLQATPAQAKSYSKEFKQLSSLGNQAGSFVGSAMYDSGIQAAQGLIDGLKSKLKNITDMMRHVADVMVYEIKKKLGIHSPSMIFHKMGVNVMHGLANGVAAGYDTHVSDALATVGMSMEKSIDNSVKTPIDMTKRDSNGRPIVVNVSTQEINPVKHAADLGFELGTRVG